MCLVKLFVLKPHNPVHACVKNANDCDAVFDFLEENDVRAERKAEDGSRQALKCRPGYIRKFSEEPKASVKLALIAFRLARTELIKPSEIDVFKVGNTARIYNVIRHPPNGHWR